MKAGILASLFLLAAKPAGDAELIVLAGQSNMNGLGNLNQLPDAYTGDPPANVLIWKEEKSGKGAFVPLEPQGYVSSKHFGPEVAFGFAAAKARPETTFYLVKSAWSGTDLHKQWNPRSRDLYTKTVNRVWTAFATAKATTRNVRLGAFLWMQGESDAITPEAAGSYERNFELLIRSFWKDLRCPHARFITARITSALKRSAKKVQFPHTETVQRAQEAVAGRIKGVEIFPTDGFGMNPDNIHYNAKGQIALGKGFAKAAFGK